MRKVALHPNMVYHIYNRGVDRGDVFFTRANRLFFLRRLRAYCGRDRGEILAYCLMPNHYHLLVRVLVEEFGRCVMHPLTVSFTKAINKQQGRVGPLFQGPFKARPVTCDEDLVALSRYVHRNPVAAGLVSRPEEWEFSSYRESTGARGGTLPQPAAILGLFPSIAAYAEYVGEEAEASSQVPKALLIDDE